jgi:hypothetical protein
MRHLVLLMGFSPGLVLALPFCERPIVGKARGTGGAGKILPLRHVRIECDFMS